MRMVAALLLAVFGGLSACSEGGDGSSGGGSVTPPAESLPGTYRLTGFETEFSVLGQNGGPQVIYDDSMVDSFRGSMTIEASRYAWSVVVDGVGSSEAGTYTIDGAFGGRWQATMVSPSGTNTVSLQASGMTLTLVDSWKEPGQENVTYRGYEFWDKISD